MSDEPTAGSAVAEPIERSRDEVRVDAARAGAHDPHRPRLWKLLTELAFISLGVFLALLADQWREDRAMRQAAAESLRGFRSEIIANREKVAAVRDYHVALLGSLRSYLAADAATQPTITVRIQGIQPVFFDQTAWDLAMGTQALAHLDQRVAASLSRIYGLQRTYHEQTRGMMQAVYLRPLRENYTGLASYYGDIVLWEPALIRMYDEVLPQIDRALAE